MYLISLFKEFFYQGTSGDPVYNVKGGGARHAADKVFQFDGKGTANIEDYYVNNF